MDNNDSPADWMIYGANGYTGRLIAEQAVQRSLRPVLAGRNKAAIEELARQLDCPVRIFSLSGTAQFSDHLSGCNVVLNCAGPFSATAVPLMDACLAAGVHYLDITGEIACIEAAADRGQKAVELGVALIPAVGFDVVPTDCLAARLAAELPSATHLTLAFKMTESLSPGTSKTILQHMPAGGRVRIDGRIVRVPMAWKIREIPFGDGTQWGMTIPWGDVSSAFYSTGIPNIEVYAAMPRRMARLIRSLRWMLHVIKLALVQRWGRRYVDRNVRGPSPEELKRSRAWTWGHVKDMSGREVEATMETPGGYALTVLTALAAVEKLRSGLSVSGFLTPSRAFGPNFIQEIPGVRQLDIKLHLS